MKRIYLSGQSSFGNRGCEAIVRSTVELLNDCFKDIEVLVPSVDIEKDKKQWPDSINHNVIFVRAYMPKHLRCWVHLLRTPIPFLKKIIWPFPIPSWLKSQIDSVDMVLSIGGDNYSLDYRIPTLSMAIDKLAMDRGKPVFIWGASVGPFEKEKSFISTITKHLSRVSQIYVRETASFEYLTSKLKLTNVSLSADPAFGLLPESCDYEPHWPEEPKNGVLGFNISPLIEKYKNDTVDLLEESSKFIRYVIEHEGMNVLLIPHVIPLDNSANNNDWRYMNSLVESLQDLKSKVALLPKEINAPQIKFTISKLRFFIGARTHSTIAALSSGVPTASIAYSVKARGINNDIFGNEDRILNTSNVSTVTLCRALDGLVQEEQAIQEVLKKQLPLIASTLRSSVREIESSIN